MKIQISIQPELPEIEVAIRAPAYSEEVEQLERKLLSDDSSPLGPRKYLLGIRDNTAKQLEINRIVRFYTENKKVYAQDNGGNWRIKTRLKELETTLEPTQFIRINQGEIVNLRFVKQMDLSLAGTIRLELQDGTSCFVARRSLPTFRKALQF